MRYVSWHSIALACLAGVLVFLQAYFQRLRILSADEASVAIQDEPWLRRVCGN